MDKMDCVIIIDGEIKTDDIHSCEYNSNTNMWDVSFTNNVEKTYSYQLDRVKKLTEPKDLDPTMYRISKSTKEFNNIKYIHKFEAVNETYYHITFNSGKEGTYCGKDLDIVKSCLDHNGASDVFSYLKEVAKLSGIKDESTGDSVLGKVYENMTYVGEDIALAVYLNPCCMRGTKENNYVPIFPFGCNNSQYKAVKNAMENQISVIEGPPGTGKTQTILNIIANVLMQGKTVQIVSNNNSALDNIYDKLSSSKYNLNFIVAKLGNKENKESFVNAQQESYPNFSSWKIKNNIHTFKNEIEEQSKKLKKFFEKQEKLAFLRQELSQMKIEYKHFSECIKDLDISPESKKLNELSSKHLLAFCNECQLTWEEKKSIGFWFKIKALLKYGIASWMICNRDISKIIPLLQNTYYKKKEIEISEEIAEIEQYLKSADKNPIEELCEQSMHILKNKLSTKYVNGKERKIFTTDDLWQNSHDVLNEYPVILSTTFSSKNSLNPNIIYDYLIMDEASQVDIATGALAISGAKNVVIVGDTKQLQNVVTEDIKKEAEDIFKRFNINDAYQYTKSFLQSVLDAIPNAVRTQLREHYRCHPKIINFCNQKFYKGELIIMTTDSGEEGVLSVVKTVKGNHARNQYNQREISVIKEEIIREKNLITEETGIVAPYNEQVNGLNSKICDFSAATVHKFQGREKENIIISMVDNNISDFADNPYLINVAISRAKKKLILVVNGNGQCANRNTTDLIDYIQYNGFKVVDSKIHSIFDYLYKQYTEERILYLQKCKKNLKYDSEKLMYLLINEIILNDKYSNLDVICNYQLNMLIKNYNVLKKEEISYAKNPATHLDFLISNKISKKPVLAVEVDGYKYHKKGTKQATRDLLKNNILKKLEIPLLRFATNGDSEKEKLKEHLDKLLGYKNDV